MLPSYAPPSPTKLPAFKPPRLEAQRPPSPINGPEDVEAGLLAPVGCELVVHNISPTGSLRTTDEVIRHALKTISDNDPELAEIPVQHSFSLPNTPSACSIRLRSDVASLDSIPRPDLLDLWIEPLRKYNPEWVVDWARSTLAKDRRLWVGIKGFYPELKKEMIEKVRAEFGKLGHRSVGGFILSTNGSMVLNMASLKAANQLLEKKTIFLPSISSRPLEIDRFKTIQPDYAFELAITGLDHYDPTVATSLDKFFSSNYLDGEGNTLWHRSRVVDGTYLFMMRDWHATARVLRDKETFKVYSAETEKLMFPRLLYNVNTTGKWSENVMRAIKNAAAAVSSDYKALERKVEALSMTVNQGFREAESRFNSLTSGFQALTTSISSLQTQVQNQSYALLSMQQRNSITERKHHLQNFDLHLRMKLDIADDDEKPQILENIRRIQAEIEEADQQGIELSKAFNGFITPTIQPPPIAAAPSNGESASQGNPSTSPTPAQNTSSQTVNNPTQLTPPGIVNPTASNIGQKRTYTEQGVTTADKSKRSRSTANGPKRKSPRTHENEMPVHAEDVPDSQDVMMDNA